VITEHNEIGKQHTGNEIEFKQMFYEYLYNS